MAGAIVVSAAPDHAARRHIAGVAHTIAVSAGKGGVGKTTVSVNTAIALSLAGASVGLLDADVSGPNVPMMMGITDAPRQAPSGKLQPALAHGVRVMSFGTILKPGQPVIWRGPMLGKALHEFLYEVEWGDLDYLVVDLPPGTGDVQLSLAQSVPLAGTIIVTTPQDVAIADVSRGIAMFRELKVDVLGVVENMSGFVCSHCGEETDIFGGGGGRDLATASGVPFLGRIPLDPDIRLGGGAGWPLMASSPDSLMGKAFSHVAAQVVTAVSRQRAARTGPVMPSGPRLPMKP